MDYLSSTRIVLTREDLPYLRLLTPIWHDDPHNKYLRMAVIRTADDKYEVVVSETYKRVFHSLSEMPEYLAVQLALVMAASAKYGTDYETGAFIEHNFNANNGEFVVGHLASKVTLLPNNTPNDMGWESFNGAYCVVVPVAVLEELRGESGDTRSKSKSKGKEDSSRA